MLVLLKNIKKHYFTANFKVDKKFDKMWIIRITFLFNTDVNKFFLIKVEKVDN